MTNSLVSGNGRFTLTMQDDGNLVAYDRGRPYWATNTFPPAPPPPPPAILPRLIRAGQFFRQEDGPRWTAIECSDFHLFGRYCDGDDISPVLEQRRAIGFNLLRVFTLYDLEAAKIGTLLHPAYGQIPEFLALCAQYGLRVEFVAYTSLERPDHWGKLCLASRAATNVMLELVNEGTLPVNYIDMARYARPEGVLVSHGSGGAEGVPPWEPWDYCTFHTNGASEEQRKIGHNAMSDLADVHRVPTITNETSRYPDVGMWVNASVARQEQLAFDSAAGAALLCAGSCFHSALGKRSVLFDSTTECVARAWVAGATSIPVAEQTEPYGRRDDLLTPDLLRVYQRGHTMVRIRK